MKYKIGDRVRVKECLDGINLKGKIGKVIAIGELYDYGIEFDEPIMRGHSCDRRGKCGCCRWGSETELEPADDKKIVITTDRNTTLARLYEGKKVVKTAKAICSPDDEFDFQIGAKLAFDRLFKSKTKPVKGEMYKVVGNTNNFHYFPIGEKVKCISVREGENSFFRSEKTGKCQFVSDCDVEIIVSTKYYSGKVVCVEAGEGTAYTVGKIYEFKDGKVRIDNGCTFPSGDPIKSLDEWNNFNWALAKFIELKE